MRNRDGLALIVYALLTLVSYYNKNTDSRFHGKPAVFLCAEVLEQVALVEIFGKKSLLSGGSLKIVPFIPTKYKKYQKPSCNFYCIMLVYA